MADLIDPLTNRELTVLSLIASGHSVHQIATLLRLTPATVENHKRRIYHKFGVSSQSQAVSRAISLGLFDTPRTSESKTTAAWSDPELVVVHARPGAPVGEVTEALVGSGLPFVVTREPDLSEDHGVRWHRGRFIAVLVDPLPDDWQLSVRIHAPVVVVPSSWPQPATVMDAMRRGANALVWLDDVPDHLCAALTMLTQGYFVMNVAYLDALNEMGGAGHPMRLPELSPREREILDSIVMGHTVRQTARLLGIAVKTVENTQARLFRKLAARNRPEAMTNAYRLGLIPQAARN
jgi:DNA-binding NarL/FixJ family response regulator